MMRAWQAFVVLAMTWLASCEDGARTQALAEDSLGRIEKSAAEGFLPAVASTFEGEDRSLGFAMDRKETIGGKTAQEFRMEYRRRVAKILLDHWQTVSKRELRSAANPAELENQEWNRKNKENLDRMFGTLADPRLSEKWKSLSEECRRIEDELMASLAGKDADECRGKMLVWSEGINDRDLRSCALEVLRPLAPGKEWLVKDKAPGDAARKAAWGTLEIRADIQLTDYVPIGAPREQKATVKVPTSLKITIRPRIPDRPGLPEKWEVEVVKPNPERIYKGTQLNAKLAASRLTVERVRELLSEGCKKLRERGITR